MQSRRAASVASSGRSVADADVVRASPLQSRVRVGSRPGELGTRARRFCQSSLSPTRFSVPERRRAESTPHHDASAPSNAPPPRLRAHSRHQNPKDGLRQLRWRRVRREALRRSGTPRATADDLAAEQLDTIVLLPHDAHRGTSIESAIVSHAGEHRQCGPAQVEVGRQSRRDCGGPKRPLQGLGDGVDPRCVRHGRIGILVEDAPGPLHPLTAKTFPRRK